MPVYCWQILSIFVFWESLNFSLTFENNFTGCRILDWLFFFFQHFKRFTSPCSCLHDLRKELQCYSYLCLSMRKVFFPSFGFFQDFFFVFDILHFEYHMPRYRFFLVLILFYVFWASCICGLVSDINFGKFSFVAPVLFLFLFLFSLWHSPYACVTTFVIASIVLGHSLFNFFSHCISVLEISMDISLGLLIVPLAMSSVLISPSEALLISLTLALTSSIYF